MVVGVGVPFEVAMVRDGVEGGRWVGEICVLMLAQVGGRRTDYQAVYIRKQRYGLEFLLCCDSFEAARNFLCQSRRLNNAKLGNS